MAQNKKPKQRKLANKNNENAPATTQVPDDPDNSSNPKDSQNYFESSAKEMLPSDIFTIKRFWIIMMIVDLLFNNWIAHQNFLKNTYSNFLPLTIDIPHEFHVTCSHFGWTSMIRFVLFLTLWIMLKRTYSRAKKDDQKAQFYVPVFNITVSSIMLLHLVGRILLDSEQNQNLNSKFYWTLVVWNFIGITAFTLVNHQTINAFGSDEKDQTDKQKEVALTRRERKLIDPVKIDKSVIYKLLHLYKPYIGYVVIGYIFLVINASVTSLKPYYKAKVIDIIKSEEPAKDLTHLVMCLGTVAIVSSVTSGVWSGLSSLVRNRLHFQIRSRLFQWMINQDMGFFDKTKTGELTSCLSSDTESLGGVLNRFGSIIKSIAHLVVMILSMGQLSWQLTLVVVTGNLYLVLGTRIYGNYTKNLYKNAQQARRQASGIAQEVLSAIRTVRSFGSEEEEIGRYGNKCQEHFDLQMTEAWMSPTYEAVDELFSLLLSSATIFYGGHLAVSGRISSGDLVSFILYQTQMVSTMSRLLNVQNWLMRALGSSEKVFQYLDDDSAIKQDGCLEPDKLEGRLEFRDVSFSYPTRPTAHVFDKLSFTVQPGEVVALVGPSGAGKSSCFNLIERFYHPSSGEVLLDSQPLQDYKHSYLKSKIAIVSQEPTLFGRTVRENIRYGLKDDQVDERRIIEAADNANASSFIKNFPDGFQTYVGEKGLQLSGGQKQRVAIARALVRNPSIILLDEATSALDAESENQVQEALDRTLPGRTVMIIAHRLSTVQKADRILVLNRGSIVEQGSHDELLKKEGLYFKLVQRQLFQLKDNTDKNR